MVVVMVVQVLGTVVRFICAQWEIELRVEHVLGGRRGCLLCHEGGGVVETSPRRICRGRSGVGDRPAWLLPSCRALP